MKIVFLDGHTCDIGDIDMASYFEGYEFRSYSRSTLEEGKERGKEADIIVVNKYKVDQESIQYWPKCKLIVVSATGCNNINIADVLRANILVSNVRGYSSSSVVQHIFACLRY